MFFFINLSLKYYKLSNSETALKYYVTKSTVENLVKIDNSELVFSNTDKSIYKVSGLDSSENFKILEVSISKNTRDYWSLDYIKNLNNTF